MLDAQSARFCFDSDCTTVVAVQDDDDVFLGFDVDTWEDGREFTLSIEIFDSTGAPITTIREERTMDPDASACGVLFYGWRDGDLYRIN